MQLHECVQEATAAIRSVSSLEPKVGIVLGTGLGTLAERTDVKARVSYDAIPISLPRR